jgi:preprotein translocase subunit SecD
VISVAQPGAEGSRELANRLGDGVFYADANGDGSFTVETDPLYELGDAFVGGGDFVEARPLPPTEGVNRWQVAFRLTEDAANRLEIATQRAADRFPPQDRIAVVVRERVIAAPIVNAAISSGSGTVTMPSREEAERLAELMTQGG